MFMGSAIHNFVALTNHQKSLNNNEDTIERAYPGTFIEVRRMPERDISSLDAMELGVEV